VVEDKVGDFSGPLAGMASVMAHATTPYVLMVPCDSPMLPSDLATRLYHALVRADAEITVAHDGERMQPVFVLLQRQLLPSMENFLAEGGRKIDRWYAAHRLISVDFSDKPEAFVNVNTLEEREELGQKLIDADQQQS
jgi:molybdopterin-guanine dinucleotide biosynthesis protein A